MTRLLLGETQDALALAMQEYFTSSHFSVETESNGLRVLSLLRHTPYDIAILEMSLPVLDAIEIVRGYRASGGALPIVLLSSRYSSGELQRALDCGADAYIVKPFKLLDLAAQVRALLRRPAMRSEQVLVSGEIEVDSEAGTVKRNDELVHLHPMEYRLLQFLLRHPNQVFSSHALFERVWQKAGNMEDTVRTHVRTLRKKLDSPDVPSVIITVRGLGYKVENP